MNSLLQTLSDDLAQVAERIQPALVQITDGKSSIGSGTIWHKDGLIVTNAHVIVERARRWRGRFGQIQRSQRKMRDVYVVLSDGRQFDVNVLAVDEDNDLAALAIDAQDLPTITVGDSHAVKAGHWVMAMGHPWGVVDSITGGVVIGAADDLPEMRTGREWLALNLRLRPGHSGGPLVNIDGELIGVNTMITGPEVGFAIPAHTVKAFMKKALGEPVSDVVVV